MVVRLHRNQRLRVMTWARKRRIRATTTYMTKSRLMIKLSMSRLQMVETGRVSRKRDWQRCNKIHQLIAGGRIVVLEQWVSVSFPWHLGEQCLIMGRLRSKNNHLRSTHYNP